MKIVAVYGSGRAKSFSAAAVDEALGCFNTSEHEVKAYHLARMNFGDCHGCFACRLKEGCVQKDDMTDLLNDIISADFVILSAPIYAFDVCGDFRKMFDRLYPMLEGNKGAAGMPEKKTLRLPYSPRYPKVKCMLILSAGAASLMCRGAKKRMERSLRFNGFAHLGTVVVDGTYGKKERDITGRQRQKISAICGFVQS